MDDPNLTVASTMNHLAQVPPAKTTLRSCIVATLTREILKNHEPNDFSIASEHQLCRRFNVSRVTVRLALGDLEHRSFIYRRHGKGTYAHGRSKRASRSLGILIKSPDALKQASIVEIIRGVQAVSVTLRSSLVLISASPLEWRPEMASSLAGVIVMDPGVTADELGIIKKNNLPFFCIQEPDLAIEENDYFNIGLRAAETLGCVAVTEEPVGEVTGTD